MPENDLILIKIFRKRKDYTTLESSVNRQMNAESAKLK